MECDLFAEHIDYVEDVCKLISHVAVREADRVRAKHGQVSDEELEKDHFCHLIISFQVNLHIYGPQVIVAANTFCMDPTSKIAKETFENFCDMWRYLVNDVIQVAKEILESFKSFSLLECANTSATSLKTSPSNRTYFNSVFQNNRDPFSRPPRTQHRLASRPPGQGQPVPAPILTNGGGGPPRHCAPMGQGRSAGYAVDRGHPDTGLMQIQENTGVRWSEGEQRLSSGRQGHGPGHTYPAGEWGITLQCCRITAVQSENNKNSDFILLMPAR